MYKTTTLLFVTIFAVALMAPPVGSQTRKVTLEDVTRDVLDVQHLVAEMQRSADTRNAEMKTLLEQILSRFSAIDSSVHKLGDSLAAIKAADEKSARELGEAKADLTKIKASLDSLNQVNLDETLTNMKSQFTGFRKQIDDLQNSPSAGPAPREVFNAAYAELQQGFNDLAINDFRDFLNSFPKDVRAPDAQISIGTAYFNQKKYDQALLEYDKTIQTYPESDRKCTALYKKGLTLVQLTQTSEANKIFQSVAKDCANTESGPLAAEQLKKPPARPGRGAK